MPVSKDTFINQFQKGASENANMGFGTFLGVETYSKKGIAQLTKDSTEVAGSGSVVTGLPIYFTSETESSIFAQSDNAEVYHSNDFGSTWSDVTGTWSGIGGGLIFYQGYNFAFIEGDIYYQASPYGSANWTIWQTGLNGNSHFPFLNPIDNNVYFGNGNMVGKFGSVFGMTFNPAGTNGVDYLYTKGPNVLLGGNAFFGLILPDIYQVNCISFLPPGYLYLGTGSSGIGNSSQVADIIPWNPYLQTYEFPLRLFSQAGAGAAGVNQLINRNNVLYAVTGGNHAIFATNGTSYILLDDISLHTTGRLIPPGGIGKGTGQQSTAPIFINQYPSAIAIMGNKLFTGVSTSINSLPAGYGNFPLGVWSEAFNSDGNALQCEFTISSGVVVSTTFSIGAIYPVNQGQMLIGWYDGTNYGIDKTEYQNFQSDPSVVMIESEMMEIGTPLDPAVITTIQENIVRSLLPGQTINVYWRNAFDQPYALLDTFDSTTGNIQLNNSLKTVVNQIGAVKFIQIAIDMATGGSNLPWTPELKNIIVSPK